MALALSTACATGGLPTTHYYTLGAPADVAAAATSTAAERPTLGVESFAVDPPYDQDRIVYRESGDSSEIGYYNYHRWASPLGRLVQHALVRGLAGTPGVAAVEPAGSQADYVARLRGRVLYLEEVSGGREVRVAVHFELSGPAGEALWSETLAKSRVGAAGDGRAAAAAAGAALEELIGEARGRIASAISSEAL